MTDFVRGLVTRGKGLLPVSAPQPRRVLEFALEFPFPEEEAAPKPGPSVEPHAIPAFAEAVSQPSREPELPLPAAPAAPPERASAAAPALAAPRGETPSTAPVERARAPVRDTPTPHFAPPAPPAQR